MPDSAAMNFLDQNVRSSASPKFSNLTVVGTITAGSISGVTSGTNTFTTVNATSVNATNIDAGADAVAGSIDIFPATTLRGKAAITCTNQTGNTTVGIVVGAMGQATVVTLPDPGAATSWILQSTAARTAISGTVLELNSLVDLPGTFTMATTPGSGTCAVQFVFKKMDGTTTMAHAISGIGYVSSSTGLAIAAATSVATLTNGVITQLVAGTIFHFITSAAGLLGVTLVAVQGNYYITFQLPNGKLATSAAIVTNA